MSGLHRPYSVAREYGVVQPDAARSQVRSQFRPPPVFRPPSAGNAAGLRRAEAVTEISDARGASIEHGVVVLRVLGVSVAVGP